MQRNFWSPLDEPRARATHRHIRVNPAALLLLSLGIAAVALVLGIVAARAQGPGLADQVPATLKPAMMACSANPPAPNAPSFALCNALWLQAESSRASLQYQLAAPPAHAFFKRVLQTINGGPVAHYRLRAGAVLNDLTVTPGAIGELTKEQLCDPAFRTGTIRNVTKATKYQVCAAYGLARADCTGAKVEIDHLISLELGGSNDVANLWPEPYEPKPGAREKDVVEDTLHREVCAGTVTLAQAQLQISTDWFQVYEQLNAPAAQAEVRR